MGVHLVHESSGWPDGPAGLAKLSGLCSQLAAHPWVGFAGVGWLSCLF